MVKILDDSIVNAQDVPTIERAVRNHFNPDTSYDGFKYGFSMKTKELTREEFEKLPNYHKIMSIYKQYKTKNDLVLYFMANYLAGKKHITEYDAIHLNHWLGSLQSIEYTFTDEIQKMYEVLEKRDITFTEYLVPFDRKSTPQIYTDSWNINTITQMQIVLHFAEAQRQVMTDPLNVIRNYGHKLIAYAPFIVPYTDVGIVSTSIITTFKNIQ